MKSNPNDCKNCPYKYKCTESKNNIKILTLHVFHEYMELVEKYRLPYKDIYKKRSQTIERVFADGKENNNLRYTRLKRYSKR
ncbi:MAG: transposase [Faecalibacillus sp.]